MTKAKLMSMVGETVKVSFYDGHTEIGKLGYTTKFCEEQGWRKPNYFTINDWDFKVSHIKKCTKVTYWSCACWEDKNDKRRYFGWSVGCPRYKQNDGLHNRQMAFHYLSSKEEAIEEWDKESEQHG